MCAPNALDRFRSNRRQTNYVHGPPWHMGSTNVMAAPRFIRFPVVFFIYGSQKSSSTWALTWQNIERCHTNAGKNSERNRKTFSTHHEIYVSVQPTVSRRKWNDTTREFILLFLIFRCRCKWTPPHPIASILSLERSNSSSRDTKTSRSKTSKTRCTRGEKSTATGRCHVPRCLFPLAWLSRLKLINLQAQPKRCGSRREYLAHFLEIFFYVRFNGDKPFEVDTNTCGGCSRRYEMRGPELHRISATPDAILTCRRFYINALAVAHTANDQVGE